MEKLGSTKFDDDTALQQVLGVSMSWQDFDVREGVEKGVRYPKRVGPSYPLKHHNHDC